MPPKLMVSKDDAIGAIDRQLECGQALLQHFAITTHHIDGHHADTRQWRDDTFEILRSVYDTDENAKSFRTASSTLVMGVSLSPRRAPRHVDQSQVLREYLGRLSSLRAGLLMYGDRPVNGGLQVSAADARTKGQTTVNQTFNGSVGNVATNSQHFQQQSVVLDNPIDSQQLPLIAEQLEVLRRVLISNASEADHFRAIAAITEAETEAKAGNSSKVKSALGNAGKWALEFAKSASTELAAKVIAEAMTHHS